MNRFDRGGDGPAIAANRPFLCAPQSEVDVGEARLTQPASTNVKVWREAILATTAASTGGARGLK